MNAIQVLLCDDNEFVLGSLKIHLEKIGCAVKAVSSGYDALDLMKKQNFDCVITDYRMTNGDGGMLAHYCADHGVPCVVMTGYVQEDVEPYLPKSAHVIEKIEFSEKIKEWSILRASQGSEDASTHPLSAFIKNVISGAA